MRRVITSALIVVCILIGTCGCSKKEEEPKIDKKSITEGLYILTAKGEYYAPTKDGETFTSSAAESNPSRVIYSINDGKEIPTLYSDDQLVYFSANDIPETFIVESFEDAGYTIGAYGIQKNTNGKLVISGESLIEGSDFYSQLKGSIQSSATLIIDNIDGEEISDNDLSSAGSIKSLDKGEDYNVGIYKGTYYADLKTKADTHLFYSSNTSSTDGYKSTKDGYAVVNTGISDNGYYSINNAGLIRVCVDEERP